jgi:hypothetical protein
MPGFSVQKGRKPGLSEGGVFDFRETIYDNKARVMTGLGIPASRISQSKGKYIQGYPA